MPHTGCRCCEANAGIKRISPADTIHAGEHWLLEHAYPTNLLGWLVVVLRRHCENLHELTRAEWSELAGIQFAALAAMRGILDLDREYVACFAEMEGFKHIHFHMIPKHRGCGPESVGVKAFHHLKVEPSEAISAERVIDFCARAKRIVSDCLDGILIDNDSENHYQ
jgi:diadenosine tetraphosphate (Ap4A) HIT family hydrolase